MAVIKAIQKKDSGSKIFFIGSRFGLESRLIPKIGIKYYGIKTGKFRRYHKSKILNVIDPTTIFKNITDFWRFLLGIKEARTILIHEKPDVVFAKGGFVSLPVGVAARTLKIPVVIHESDMVMGLANKIMTKFARKVCVSFPAKYFPNVNKERLIQTGNPIRDDILMGDKRRFLSENGFDSSIKTILILGGSQGSLFLNETVLEIIENLLDSWQVIWVAGDRDADLVIYKTKTLDERLKKRLKVFGFLTSEIADVYAACDLVIARAGSNVLFELAALGKPAILVPHNVSPGGHQFENARLFSRSGAAYILPQEGLNPQKLLHQIGYLFRNEKELVSMSEKMRSLADPDASGKVANLVYEEGRKSYEANRKAQEKK